MLRMSDVEGCVQTLSKPLKKGSLLTSLLITPIRQNDGEEGDANLTNDLTWPMMSHVNIVQEDPTLSTHEVTGKFRYFSLRKANLCLGL